MYALFVLACLVSNPKECVTLQDLYSPHKNHDTCLARAYIIAKEMQLYMPNYFPKSYKCLNMETEADKVDI